MLSRTLRWLNTTAPFLLIVLMSDRLSQRSFLSVFRTWKVSDDHCRGQHREAGRDPHAVQDGEKSRQDWRHAHWLRWQQWQVSDCRNSFATRWHAKIRHLTIRISLPQYLRRWSYCQQAWYHLGDQRRNSTGQLLGFLAHGLHGQARLRRPRKRRLYPHEEHATHGRSKRHCLGWLGH